MAKITLQPGDTLAGIAQKYGTDPNTLRTLNPQITSQLVMGNAVPATLAGTSLQVPESAGTGSPVLSAPTTPALNETSTPSILTTDDVRDQFKGNVEKLASREAQFAPNVLESSFSNLKETKPLPTPQGDFVAEILQSDPPIQIYRDAAGNITRRERIQQGGSKQLLTTQSTAPITIKTDNAALKGLADSANQLISQFQTQGGTLTPEMQDALNKINGLDIEKTSAVADSRVAADKKDAEALNEAMQKAETAEGEQQSAINTLIAEMKKAREDFMASFVPTERETELKRELQALRSGRQLLPLELRKEGISAAGIAGRQVEDERVRAIQEQNLLFELGLEKESREFKTKSFEKQLEFISKDIDLQNKIEERIEAKEQKAQEYARTLRKDSLDALQTIVETYSGLNFNDLDAESQGVVLKRAQEFGIDPAELINAMSAEKDRVLFERAKALQKTEKPATAAQTIVATYASRIEQANPTIAKLEDTIQGMNWLSFKAQLELPAALQSAEIQQYQQAERNFINAVLRRESGAVISESEFKEARQQYIPQPGDTEEVLKEKELNRQIVFSSFKNAAGPAYQSIEELLGDIGISVEEKNSENDPLGIR